MKKPVTRKWMIALMVSLMFSLFVPSTAPQAVMTVSAKTTAKKSKAKSKKKSRAKLNHSTKTLQEKQSFTLRVKGTKSAVSWKSSNSSVAKVKKKGKYAATVTAKESGSATITARVGEKKLKCVVTVPAKENIYEKKRDQIYLTAGVTNAMQDQYKCFLLAKWICDNTVYEFGSTQGQTYEEVLTEGTGVCAGVSKLYWFLLKGQNISSIYVTGTSEEVNHGWNQVLIDGEWYNVDITWMGVYERLEKRFYAGYYDMYYFLFPDDALDSRRTVSLYSPHYSATSRRFWNGDDPNLTTEEKFGAWFNGGWVNY